MDSARSRTHDILLRSGRPRVRGKFLHARGEKLYLRGVTYGAFRPRADGSPYPRPEVVSADFIRMAEAGINAVRTYTVPPPWLLDLAAEHGLRLMVGLAWEQHVAFLDERSRRRSIEERVREGVAGCAGHPAVLCYALGNEIPASIVRWYGRRRVERFLAGLYDAAKDEDPDGLCTYVNYPSTEYLELPFCDLVCFNVYLEHEDELDSYFARLQNLAGDRPLVLAELGLDSRRNGVQAQASLLDRQLRMTFTSGCAGAFVFAWTDEWHRGGHEVEDWDFGLVDRARRPKPALAAVEKSFAEPPFPRELDWPRVSVCVCTRNGAATLRECLDGIAGLDYPDVETIVVDDGSSDGSAAVAAAYDVRLIRGEQRGLSAARNAGVDAATGEIVAFLDDDAYPDRDWLRHLATAFLRSDHAGVGGPNLPPPDDGFVAGCVAHAPGAPVHVLLGDREAEHIPGCNMAFRKEALEGIGGFDPQFRTAGDDVDVCWRLDECGFTLGFSPAAVVWHRRRGSVRAYLRQQRGYGEAEALLEQKWPEKYNRGGHPRWRGRVYDRGTRALFGVGRRRRVRYGTWGSAPFQSVYEREPGRLAALPATPEWYLLLGAFVLLAGYESLFGPLLGVALGAPLLILCATALVFQAWRFAGASLAGAAGTPAARARCRALVTALALLQPLARLSGRLRRGLTPWRSRGASLAPPLPVTCTVWCEQWRSPTEMLGRLERSLRARRIAVRRGGDFDRWDIHVFGGSLGGARVRLAVEEHGAGRQLFRYRVWPTWARGGGVLLGLVAAALALVVERGELLSSALLALLLAALSARMLRDAAAAVATTVAVARSGDEQSREPARPSEPVAEPAQPLERLGDAA